VDVESARAQRRSDLESDEARADDERALRAGRLGDDRAAVGERAQIESLVARRAGDVESNRLGAGREQQRVVVDRRRPCRAAGASH
jgi:hypothetical protein